MGYSIDNGINVVNIGVPKAEFDQYKLEIVDVKNLEGFETLNRRRGAQPLVTFRDDDGSRSVIELLKPIFTAESVPLTVAIPIVANNLTVEEMLELQNDYGWEFISHTYNHAHLDAITDEQLDYELSASKEWLNSRGIKCNSIAIPYGDYNDKVLKYCRKYYRGITYSRVTGRNRVPIESALKIVELIEAADLDSESGFYRNTIEHYKFQVDKAIEENSWVVFMSHSYSYDATQLGYLQELIQYIKSRDVDIVTMNEGLNRMGNIVETGLFFKYGKPKPHFVIGADGEYVSSDKPVRYIPSSKADNYDSYVHDTISVVALTKNEAIGYGYPGSSAGTLITYKLGSTIDAEFTRQEFQIIGTDRTYIRFYDKTNRVWGAWASSARVVKIDSSLDGSTTLQSFETNKITYTVLGKAQAVATGMPGNSSGLLVTSRFGTKGWAYQEWFIYGSNKRYKRYGNQDNTWSEWELVYPTNTVIIGNVTPLSSSPITDFQTGKITYTKILNEDAAGFPETTGGVLVTNRMLGDGGFSYQDYIIANTGNTYRRSWTSSEAWSSWKQIEMV